MTDQAVGMAKAPQRLRNRILGCGAISVAVIALLALLIAVNLGYLPIRPFESTSWTESAETNDGVRISMIDNLVGSGALDGRSRSEVLAILGTPHDGSYFRNHDLVYYLGGERGWMGIDSEWLVIDFDANDRVETYEVVTD